MSLDSITEQAIAGIIAGLVVAALLGWWKRRQRNKEEVGHDVTQAVEEATAAVDAIDVEAQPSTFDEKAHRLLKAIYDLAGGNPGTTVFTEYAAQKAGITTVEELDPIVKYLKDERLVDNMKIVHNTHLKITPAGIRVVQ